MAATIGPRIVQVLEFASARAPELQALHEVAHHAQMLSPADAKLDTQRNQRRRRANAFKSHRMPQRLRQKKAKPGQEEELIALPARGATEVKQQHESAPSADGTGKQQSEKPRARKHERRPHKLLAARSWQQQSAPRNDDSDAESKTKAVWLTTHLWHSKRMKMVEKYGVALPAHRADKSVSASLEVRYAVASITLSTISATYSECIGRILVIFMHRRFAREQRCTTSRTMASWSSMGSRSSSWRRCSSYRYVDRCTLGILALE